MYKSEFEIAGEMLNSCIGTIKCGCQITPDEGLDADYLYYRCRDYMKAYDEAKYWESSNRRKE